jgi:ABC-type uncharacterized transport system involved in gliding motility auxiliary subunit
MEIKGKHIYGIGAAVAGAAALIFALLYWIINRQWDTTTQAGLAIGLLGLVLFAWLEIDWLTRLLKTRQVRYGAESMALTVLFLVVIGLLTYIFTREGFQKSWDLTSDQQFTLTPETTNVLSQMSQPVKVLAFYSPASFGREDTETLLSNYSTASNQQVTYEFIDPNSQPALAQEYGVTIDRQLVVTRGDQREEVQFANESDLTNAIVRLDDATVRTVYFVAGHGEASIEDTGQEGLSTIKQYLEGVNVTVKTLNVLGDSVPVDATAIVIAGPQQPYSQSEVDLLARYVNGGGKLVILAEPSILQGVEAGQPDPLANYLATSWGITLRDDFVIETSNYYESPQNIVTYNFTETSPIVEGLSNYAALFPLARSIDISVTLPESVIATPVIKTFPSAWGETNLGALSGEGEVAPDANEPSGELVLAATGQNTATNGRVVVFGDATFAQNQFWQNSGASNGLIMLNSVKWVTSKEDTISLTPRNTTTRTLNIFSMRDLIIVSLLSCLLPLLVVAGLGIGVWWSRRRG